MSDAVLALHGTATTPSNVFTSTSSDYSDSEIDFGAAADGSASPYIPEFPSRTEAAYTLPPENPGEGGVQFGVHVIISAAVVPGSMTSANITVVSDPTTSATTVIASRTFTNGQVGASGAHYFIPVPGSAVKRFLRANFLGVGAACSSGTAFAWYGPKTGGEL
jgi:hypothetical protein